MKAIGGYFGLELNKGEEYHENAIKLNTGRNALEYILLVNNYKKVFLPFFTCDVLLEPLNKLNIEVAFYSINKLFEPIFDYSRVKEDEAFLYTNYFGLKDNYIKRLAVNCKNLIIDNAQSFYSKPLQGIDTFYSPRKFFGVPDGAYLYCNRQLDIDLEQDISYNRFEHLLRRIDISAEDGYPYFKENDNSLSNQPIKEMSNLTQSLLRTIDYKKPIQIRKDNFNFLHKNLKDSNKLNLDEFSFISPMVYPYWTENEKLKQRLLENKIYTPTYWPNVKEWSKQNSLENTLVNEVIYLSVDQRQTEKELNRIVKIIKNEY